MPKPLVRYQASGHTHFVTFSCRRRQPHPAEPSERDLLERSLDTMRLRYDFQVFGYVVMPEHVHLLLSEPKKCPLFQSYPGTQIVGLRPEEKAALLASPIL